MNEVSALAIEAKSNKVYLVPLWVAVERLVHVWAINYCQCVDTRLFDLDDLMQAGYLAVNDAVPSYSADRGEFVTFLIFHVRRKFAEVAGRGGTKKRPEVFAISLDVPIGDDSDSTRAETLADPCAHQAYDDILDHETNRQHVAALMTEIAKLSDVQRRVLMLTAWDGKTVNETAAILGVTPAQARQQKLTAIHRIRTTRTARIIAARVCI